MAFDAFEVTDPLLPIRCFRLSNSWRTTNGINIMYLHSVEEKKSSKYTMYTFIWYIPQPFPITDLIEDKTKESRKTFVSGMMYVEFLSWWKVWLEFSYASQSISSFKHKAFSEDRKRSSTSSPERFATNRDFFTINAFANIRNGFCVGVFAENI